MGPADELLAARLVAGDDDALAEAFDRYAPSAFATALRVLHDQAAAQDVVQDVFVRLWQHPDRYDAARGTMQTYLLLLTHRHALDVVRSDMRRADRQLRHGRLVPEQAASPEDEVESSAVAGVVRDAVRTLPAEQRRVVELAYFEGLSYRDVAVVVGIPEGTAKSRLRLALAKLEAALDRQLLETS